MHRANASKKRYIAGHLWVVLCFRSVFADSALLTALGLVEAPEGKDKRGGNTPNGSLGHGISHVMAFEQLRDTNYCKCADEKQKEAFKPESSTQEILRVRACY